MYEILSLLVLTCLLSLAGYSQKDYRLVFRDTTDFILTDSVQNLIKQAFRQQLSLDEKTEFKLPQPSAQNNRIVTTHTTYTVISIDRESIEGDGVTFDDKPLFFDSLLLKDGELYEDAHTKTGFADFPIKTPKKDFQFTERVKEILNHSCREYMSTDSVCKVWITGDLPSSINPGVRLKDIKGAVLAFELRQEGVWLRSIAVKMND